MKHHIYAVTAMIAALLPAPAATLLAEDATRPAPTGTLLAADAPTGTLLAEDATLPASAGQRQMPDTTNLYGDRRDSLGAAVATGRQAGSYLMKGREIRTEAITAAGLCKMACCNLAESFENSASVSVGYSDAVTGARQIRLLGQNGIYTQMLDENRPVMRGLSSPWGLNFIPSQWLESIQIAKGVTSVINGVESMTGQINLEHRKPTDEKPLYVQASYMNDTKADLNVASSLQLDETGKWSTVILGHVDGNFKTMDHNGDGFMDDPKALNYSIGNRWLYYGSDGVQVRFGVRGIRDNRTGGQTDENGWRSNILNTNLGAYVKAGVPLNEENTMNVAAIADYTWQGLESNFGLRGYDARQHSGFINLLFQDQRLDQHHLTLGLSEMIDVYDESLGLKGGTADSPAILGWGTGQDSNGTTQGSNGTGQASNGTTQAGNGTTQAGNGTTQASRNTSLNDLGVFGEYTFHSADEKTFSAIVGLRADWYDKAGIRVSPRLTLKWQPVESLVLRANGGRGIRYSTPLTDNIGVLSTGKAISGDYLSHPLEESWTFGANATWYLPFDKSEKTFLSLDWFHTGFKEQMIADYVGSKDIVFRTLSSIKDGRSTTENFQLDFSTEPFRGFTATLTGRYTDARQTLEGCTDGVKPMTSIYKAVLNLQYATHLNKWIFDFTASVNGPCRVWDFMKKYYESGYTQAYPLLYAQVTKRFKGVDIYVGGENLTNFRQKDPIIAAATPQSQEFDASCVWGPLMGIKIYGGVRVTLWKKE